MVLVSVIMSLYNHEKFVPEAIESVLNQNFKDFELIIIDDCSRDRSRDIIKKYRAKDNRIKLIFHGDNKGIAKTTNDGLDVAKGKFIALIDSDDVWVEKKLEEQLKVLEKNENLIVWTEGEVIRESSDPMGMTFTKMHCATNRKKSGNIFNELLVFNLIFKSSLIFKRKNVENIKFNERLKILDDYQFAISLARKYNYYFINEPLTKYRRHSTNITLDEKTQIKDFIKLRTYLLKKYDKYMLKSIKWYLNLEIINAYFKNGEVRKSRPYIYKLIKIFPHSPLIYWYLIKSIIKSDFILKILYLILNFYQRIILFRIECINGSFLGGNSFFSSIIRLKTLGGTFFKRLFFLGELWKMHESS